MGALLKPLAHAEMTGTAELQPSRYDNRLMLVDNREIGACPLYFDPMQREAWAELVDRLWWLNASDYQMVELASLLMAEVRIQATTEGGRHTGELIMKAINALTKLGATPTSRGNVLADRSKDGAKKSRFAK